jgi:hypothetical protein
MRLVTKSKGIEKMANVKFICLGGNKVFIVYDSKGVEVPNLYIKSSGHNQAEKKAKSLYGDKASVSYTEI